MKKLTLVSLAMLTATTLVLASHARAGKPKSADMFDEMDDKLNLYFVDALTGQPIPGATVTFEGATAVTDDAGKATFALPEVPDSKEVDLVAHFEKTGYVPSDAKVHFMLGSVWSNRWSISPALPPGKLRIVLDWGRSPADLDAHLVKDGVYHISFRNMRQYEDEVVLDRDDTDGYGPETITINHVDPNGRYTFFVHDYTDRADGSTDALSKKSRARVSVFSSERLVDQLMVPAGGKGVTWKVFEIQNGSIRPVGELATRSAGLRRLG